MIDLKGEFDFALYFPVARPISNNRNQIAKKFLAGDWDYLVMLDDDNPPLRNVLELLREDKDVVGGVYAGRDDNGIHFHCYKLKPEYPKEFGFLQYTPEERVGLRKVDALAAGCMMIRRNVLEKIKRPFEDIFDEDGILITNDDMAFCLKCREAGFEVWAHWEYVCSHYKTVDMLQMAKLVIMAAESGIPRLSVAKKPLQNIEIVKGGVK